MDNLFNKAEVLFEKLAVNVDLTRAQQYLDEIAAASESAVSSMLSMSGAQKKVSNIFEDTSTMMGGVAPSRAKDTFNKLKSLPNVHKELDSLTEAAITNQAKLNMYDHLFKQELKQQLGTKGIAIQDEQKLNKMLTNASEHQTKLVDILRTTKDDLTIPQMKAKSLAINKIDPTVDIDKFNLITRKETDTLAKKKDIGPFYLKFD